MRSLLACAALFAGCYSPSDLRCKYRCGPSNECPGNLTCNTAIGMCAASSDDMCTGMTGDADPPSDGDVDVATVRDATTCGFPPIANVDPCTTDVPMTDVEWLVNGTVDFDTDTFAGGPLAMKYTKPIGGRTVSIMALKSFTVSDGAVLRISGEPLIILVRENVLIRGRIIVNPVVNITCTGSGGDGTGATNGGGGGGGGGAYGANGGAGGPGWIDAPPGANPTMIAGAGGFSGAKVSVALFSDLDPLRPGCPGGRGGFSGALGMNRQPGGESGRGGGALQISSAGTITFVNGAIYAYGGPGNKSGGDTVTHLSGAGGGGSGGAILLEAPTIDLSGARICTNGGGGGGLVGDGRPVMNSDYDAVCTAQAGGDGIAVGAAEFDSAGQTGGDSMSPMGGSVSNAAAQADTPGRPGGGGGGGVGFVRLNRNTELNTSAVISGHQSSGSFD